MAVLCFEVFELPDLTLNKYQSLAETGVNGVLHRHENFLRQWHGICKESNTSFHLLYIYMPDEMRGKRLRLYIILQGEAAVLRMLEPLLQSSPLSDFYRFLPAKVPAVRFEAGATLIKKERIAEIFDPLANQLKMVHYVPQWKMNEQCRLYDLFRMMEILGEAYRPASACAYRLDLYPAALEQSVRDTFNPILKSLRGDNEITLVQDTDSVKSNSYANDICREYEEWMTTIETMPHFRVNMYGFAASPFNAKVLLNAAGAEAISEGDYATAAIKPDTDGGYQPLSRMESTAASYCFYTKQIGDLEGQLGCNLPQLRNWSTTYCLAEAVPFFRLPALYDGETIELPKETAPMQIPNGIYLGQDMNDYPVNFPLEYLPRHAFFTGMPGSGKTNTMLHLASSLHKNNIPFLVLEPAKKEYRALLGYEHMRDVFLFSPHLQSHFPLQMNPMEFPQGCRLSDHIDTLLEVFEETFLLEGPTKSILSRAIQQSYANLGWDVEDICGEEERQFPDLQDVYNNLEDEIKRSSYDGDFKGNVQGFMQNRLGGLIERHAGELFNTHISTIAPEEWLQVSAIVELEVLGEQAKNFFVLLICHYILEALQADPNGGVRADGEKMSVRHALFIEEAHNIIASTTQQESADSVNPKVSATKYIMKMLAEVRARREAIVIADQLPTALADQVTKNTGLKLIHRLAAQDDRQQIGAAVSASPLQLERMASFTTGRALIHHEKTLKPFEVQIAQWIPPDTAYDIADDAELYRQIMDQKNVLQQVQSSFYNWQEEAINPVVDQLIDLLERMKEQGPEPMQDDEIPYDYVNMMLLQVEVAELLSKCRSLLKKWTRLYKLWQVESLQNHQLRDEFEELQESIKMYSSWLEELTFGKEEK